MFDAGKTRMIGLLHGDKVGRYVKPFSSDTGTLQTDGRNNEGLSYGQNDFQCGSRVPSLIFKKIHI